MELFSIKEMDNVMQTYIKRRNVLLEIIVLMIILQSLLFIMESIFRNDAGTTIFSRKMITMVCMIILTVVVVIISHMGNISLSLLPEKFSKKYIVCTVIALILMLSSPRIYTVGFK